MNRILRILGSLAIAVPLLITIAAVLAWGTIYEARFGTAAVQRFVYQAWWFQALLGFLAVNLAVAALHRYPWKRKHIPFVSAHIGIILILVGGIIGGRFGIEGQLIIPEGQTQSLLQLPRSVLVVHEPNPGAHHVLPARFEETAWNQTPHTLYDVPLHGWQLQLVVDRFFPDAELQEMVSDGGAEDNPAIRLTVGEDEREESVWLFARDPERFGAAWGEAHVFFLEAATAEDYERLVGRAPAEAHPRGMVRITLPRDARAHDVPVPEQMQQPLRIPGTRYQVIFKEYFPDFALSEQGPVNRSELPNNPAVSFVLSGPEGTDAYLLFAFHPEFPELHARAHAIAAQARYTHPAGSELPPNSLAIVQAPDRTLTAVMNGPVGDRQLVEPLALGQAVAHPALGLRFAVEQSLARAQIVQAFAGRGNDIRESAIHVVGRVGDATAQAWLGIRGSAELSFGDHPVIVEYRPDQRELPFQVTLRDFRKTDYPGTQMAAGFESDVEVHDPERGISLTRTISMNNPLKHRGYSLFQSSYVDGPTQTTILSVRNDPGTPLVYAGFLIVIFGVVSLFVRHAKKQRAVSGARA